MINLTKGLNMIVIVAILFVSANIVLAVIPWYTQENPMAVFDNTEPFKPGEVVRLSFKRNALIGFKGSVVRELVRINGATGVTEEIWKSSVSTSVGKGEKEISLSYRIPTIKMYPEMESDTYRWQGCMTYRPFGLVERTVFFETEKFQISTKP